jgi:hypothetical protein
MDADGREGRSSNIEVENMGKRCSLGAPTSRRHREWEANERAGTDPRLTAHALADEDAGVPGEPKRGQSGSRSLTERCHSAVPELRRPCSGKRPGCSVCMFGTGFFDLEVERGVARAESLSLLRRLSLPAPTGRTGMLACHCSISQRSQPVNPSCPTRRPRTLPLLSLVPAG